MLNVDRLSDIVLNVVGLSVIMLNVDTHGAIMLNVEVPYFGAISWRVCLMKTFPHLPSPFKKRLGAYPTEFIMGKLQTYSQRLDSAENVF